MRVLSIIYDRLKTFSDLKTMTTYFFEDPIINLDLIMRNKYLKHLAESELEELLKTTISQLSVVELWQADNLQEALNSLLSQTNQKPAVLFSLIRLAVSFAPFSPALNLTLETLGRETTLSRLNAVARAI